ncbi:MAG: hypothetical protein JNL74_07005, partial [Fibrobacteres bacterium]|nr:hypothetical protein [Fibrobacterota bacterium]
GGFVKAGNWSAGECVEGTVHSMAGAVPESVVVEESGAQKVMIRAQGRHYASASGVTKGLYGWIVWITAYAGKPYVDVQFVLTNTLLDGAGTGTIKVYAWPIKEWKMDLNLTGSGTWQGAFCEDALTNLDINGKRLLQKVSGYVINGSASGTASQGGAILTNGSTGVRISNRDFANRSPKAITLKPALLSMEWLPDTGSVTALDPYSNYNNRFRMEFFSTLPSDSLTVFTRKANAPIRLLAPRSWYRDTDSWHRGFGLPPHSTFNRVAPSTWTRLEKPPTSWSKWGEIAGFNGVGDHWNLTSGFWNYLHTGKPSDFEFAEKYALYFNDVVSVQTPISRNKDLSYWLNCEKYLQTFGSANTEDMYHQSVSSYPGWTWRRGDRPDDGHMPNLMVLEHYYLTGDPASREAVMSQAVRAATSVYFRVYASPYGPAGDPKYKGRVWNLDTLLYYGYGPRYVGRPIIVAGQGYDISGDSLLLRPMQLYSYALRNWIRRSPIGYLGAFDAQDQGGMINTWNANNPDVPPPLGCWMTDFQNGIATEGLYNYWQQTDDPEIHDALIFSGKS